MKKNLWITALLALMLAACASKPTQQEPKAPIEDKSATAAPAPAPAAPVADNSADTSAANTAPVAETKILDPRKDPSNTLFSRSIYFDYNKDEVKAEYRPLVEAHAKYLVQHPEAKLIIQGKTDERGSREFNLALGQRRAVAVKKVLNVLGATDRQIETVSYGEEKPKASGHDEAAYAQNRRADIVYEGE